MAAHLHCRSLALGCVLALGSTCAAASPPGHWAIGVERLFGVRHTTSESQRSQTSLSVGSQYLPGNGYSTPRVAFDYLLDLGLSFGGAFAYGTFEVDRAYDDYSDPSWLVAPRVGFFWLPLANLGVWPRLGLTLLRPSSEPIDSLSAVTLEAPVVFLLPAHIVTFTATPYLELGYSAGSSETELGLALGATVFF